MSMCSAAIETNSANFEFACRQELAFRKAACCFKQVLDDCIDAGLSTGSNVDLSTHASEDRRDVGRRDIADVDEIACLASIAVDERR
jgi:hypothetical protein